MIKECRSCFSKSITDLFDSGEITITLCLSCGLVQNKETIKSETNLHTIFCKFKDSGGGIFRGDYLPNIIEKLRKDLITNDKSFYFSLTSISRIALMYELEVKEVEIDDCSFKVSFVPIKPARLVRVKEQKMKLLNRSTYLLFALKVKNKK